jgi:hypothetical protein
VWSYSSSSSPSSPSSQEFEAEPKKLWNHRSSAPWFDVFVTAVAEKAAEQLLTKIRLSQCDDYDPYASDDEDEQYQPLAQRSQFDPMYCRQRKSLRWARSNPSMNFVSVDLPQSLVIDGLGHVWTPSVMQMTTETTVTEFGDGRYWRWPCHSWCAAEMHRTVARRLSLQTQALIAASFLALTGSKFSGGIRFWTHERCCEHDRLLSADMWW